MMGSGSVSEPVSIAATGIGLARVLTEARYFDNRDDG